MHGCDRDGRGREYHRHAGEKGFEREESRLEAAEAYHD
jgi:hypothetical protein